MLGLDWQQEVVKAIPSILVAVVTLSLGWLVGQRLTVYWAIRQKRRELELAALTEFYRLYGEFFTVWKLWAYCQNSNLDLALPDFTRWELLKRASTSEGALESLLVKLSSERELVDEDVEILGRFRQGYQRLRESIRDNRNIGWSQQNHPEYLTFKRLAYLVSCIILSDVSPGHTADNRIVNALEVITSNAWEARWVLTEADWNRLKGRFGKNMQSREFVGPIE